MTKQRETIEEYRTLIHACDDCDSQWDDPQIYFCRDTFEIDDDDDDYFEHIYDESTPVIKDWKCPNHPSKPGCIISTDVNPDGTEKEMPRDLDHKLTEYQIDTRVRKIFGIIEDTNYTGEVMEIIYRFLKEYLEILNTSGGDDSYNDEELKEFIELFHDEFLGKWTNRKIGWRNDNGTRKLRK